MGRIKHGFGVGGALLTDQTADGLAALLRSHEGLRFSVVSGAFTGVQIALTGITTSDQLIAVIEFASGVPTARTGNFEILSNGFIQGDLDTSGDYLLVIWRDADGEIGSTATAGSTETTTTTTTTTTTSSSSTTSTSTSSSSSTTTTTSV